MIDDSDLSSEDEQKIDYGNHIDNVENVESDCDNAGVNVENIERILESFELPELVASFNSNLLSFFLCKTVSRF